MQIAARTVLWISALILAPATANAQAEQATGRESGNLAAADLGVTDIDCAMRMMFIEVKSAEAATASEGDARAEHLEFNALSHRALFFYLGRMGNAMSAAEIGRQSNMLYEQMRGQTQDEIARRNDFCFNQALDAEQVYLSSFEQEG